jgi:hypothetical protein
MKILTVGRQRNWFSLPPNNTVATIRSEWENKKGKGQAMELLRIYTLKREKVRKLLCVKLLFFFVFVCFFFYSFSDFVLLIFFFFLLRPRNIPGDSF